MISGWRRDALHSIDPSYGDAEDSAIDRHCWRSGCYASSRKVGSTSDGMTSRDPHLSHRRARTTRPIIRACRGTCIVFAKGKIGRGLVGGVGEVRVSWSNQTTNSPKARSIPASPFNQMAETYAFSSGTTMSEASKRLRKSCCCAGCRFSSKAAIGRTLNATTSQRPLSVQP